jgi:hypothetical protein
MTRGLGYRTGSRRCSISTNFWNATLGLPSPDDYEGWDGHTTSRTFCAQLSDEYGFGVSPLQPYPEELKAEVNREGVHVISYGRWRPIGTQR